MPPKKKAKTSAAPDVFKPKNILITGGAGFMYVSCAPLCSYALC
jgi:hypothetical protein